MKIILDVLLSPRFKSFYWRTGIMAVTGFVSLLAANVGMFQFSVPVTTVVGLILGEVVKALNNYNQSAPMGFVRR